MPRSLRSASQRRNSYTQETKTKVSIDMEEYAKKLEIERRRLTNLNMIYKTLEKQFNERKQLIIQYNKSMNPTKNKLAYTQSLNCKKKTDFYSKKNDKLVGDINSLKFEIIQLRRERIILRQNIKNTANQLQELQQKTTNTFTIMESNNQKAQQAKQQIAFLRQKLDQQETNFRRQFKQLKNDYEIEMRNNFINTSHYVPQVVFDNFDTATLLKRRLQSVIINNKQKIKMIDNYQRNMKILDQAFNTIKQNSGLTNINQIEAIFVKSQEQNCSLLTYLDTLNQQIDNLTDVNEQLQRRCKQQQQENKLREQILNSTPQLQKKRLLLQEIASQKMVLVNEVNQILNKISPKVAESINYMKPAGRQKDLIMNTINYQKILGQLDLSINTLIKFKATEQNKNLFEQLLQIDSIPPKLPSAVTQKNISFINIDNKIQANQAANSVMYNYQKLQQIAKQVVNKNEKRDPKGQILKNKK